jgi:uncharacterized protein
MSSKTWRTGALAALLALTIGGSTLAAPKVGTTAGRTVGQWSADWWQWMVSIPKAENPQNDEGAVDCTRNQQGPVWHLAGAPLGVTAERSCTVPAGTPLFFPMLNGVFINEPGESFTVAEKRERLDGLFSDAEPGFLADFGLPGSRACGLHATLDGVPVHFADPHAHVQSPPFPLSTGDGPNNMPVGVVDPEAVSDGFWVMLPGLAPGEHVVRFGGALCDFESNEIHPAVGPVDVTYHLTVQGAAPGGGDPQGPPPSNLEIVLALYDAFAAGDLDTILAIIHPDVVWVESDGIPYGGTFIGRDAVFEGVFAKIAAEWDGFTAEVFEAFEADGGRVVTLGEDSGTFKATGKHMSAPTASIWTLDNEGRVVRFTQYIDTLAVHGATVQ